MAYSKTKLKELVLNNKTLFVTGTDTEIGKTYCSCLILKALKSMELTVFPFKPVSAGTNYDEHFGCEVNEDARELYLAAEQAFTLSQINPIVYEQPIAPHIAANIENRPLTKQLLQQQYQDVKHNVPVLVEGAGGWLLPLNETELMSEWVADNNIPVILVVGIKLGCLNHALLTAQAIKNSGCQLAGWIANFVEGENPIGRENVKYLASVIDAPMLFEVQQGQTELYFKEY